MQCKLDSNLCKIVHRAPITTAGKSILMDVLASSSTTITGGKESHKISDSVKKETTELHLQTCLDSDSDKITSPSSSASASMEQNCVDTHSFYLVIIIGLVISNCILSCLTIKKSWSVLSHWLSKTIRFALTSNEEPNSYHCSPEKNL